MWDEHLFIRGFVSVEVELWKFSRASRGNISNETHSKWSFKRKISFFYVSVNCSSPVRLKLAKFLDKFSKWISSRTKPPNEQILFHVFPTYFFTRNRSSRANTLHVSTLAEPFNETLFWNNYNLTLFLWIFEACLCIARATYNVSMHCNCKLHLIYFWTIKLSLRFLKSNHHKLFHERFHSRELVFHARVNHTRDCLPRLTQFDAQIHSYTRAIREMSKNTFNEPHEAIVVSLVEFNIYSIQGVS